MLKTKFYFLPAILFFSGCCAFFLLSATKPEVFAQILSNPNSSNSAKIYVSNTSAERPRLVENTVSSLPSISNSAASENFRYQATLEWVFGAKTQRGWYLYAPLIQQTLGTNADPASIEFARAVAVWQKNSLVAPTGIVDNETLFQLIKFWQSERLNSSQYAADAQLLNAPIDDFYDPTRAADLLKVDRETYAAYKKMAAAAAKDLRLKTNQNGDLAPEEKFLKIVSAFRSHEHQARLRAASPNSGSAGLAVNSPHFTGHALDLYVGGEPVTTKDFNRTIQVQTPAYKWLVKNAARFGFYPYYYEPWHWEYVPANLK